MAELNNDPAATQETPQGATQGAGDINTQASTETLQGTPQGDAQATEKKTGTRKSAPKKAGGKLVKNKPTESEYSAADLAKAARGRFNVPPEIVTAALRMANKPKATLAEAQEIVTKFMAREVK